MSAYCSMRVKLATKSHAGVRFGKMWGLAEWYPNTARFYSSG